MGCTKMMDENPLSKFDKIETTEQFYNIPKSDYVLITKRGVQHHKIHKPDCDSIRPTLSLNSNKSDNSVVHSISSSNDLIDRSFTINMSLFYF